VETKHVILVIVAVFMIFAAGTYFTGGAVVARQSQLFSYARNYGYAGINGRPSYTVEGLLIDGVTTRSQCGSGDMDGLYCPKGKELTFHVDISPSHYGSSQYCPTSPNLYLLERVQGQGLCGGTPLVLTSLLWSGYSLDGNCRYCGTFTIQNQNENTLYYDPCKLTGTGYQHPYNALGQQISTHLYPTAIGGQFCSKTSATGAVVTPKVVSGARTPTYYRA